jgi:23S rRNA (adenine2503-C2)-methyltransferase
MNLHKLKLFLEEINEPAFRFKQIKEAIYKEGILDFDKMTNLSKKLREKLIAEFTILSFAVNKLLIAKDQKSAKALLRLADGNQIETVLISVKKGFWSVCVSSQAGCPLGCQFCATGQNGFKRNLTAEEITDQVLFWQNRLNEIDSAKGKITNIVYMGMGEPFLNWDNVKKSLHDLTDKELFGFGDRSISVSTIGIPDGIKKFAKEFPQINLAISLHCADNKKRDLLCPINKRFDVSSLVRAIENYLEKNNRKVFIEYIMIERFNDNLNDAEKLVNFVKSFEKNYLLHVNLISYNLSNSELNSSSQERIEKFREFLSKQGVSVTLRKSLGGEIKGGCGQLAGK